MNGLADFRAFFHALWDHEPFPWQSMLAERVADGSWPQALDLPTAAGKTACIDVAVHALASQGETSLAERTAPRRVWFIVDRRIVVDEAFELTKLTARFRCSRACAPSRDTAPRPAAVSATPQAALSRGGSLTPLLRNPGPRRRRGSPRASRST